MQEYVDVDDADLSTELIRRLRHLERFVPPEEMGEIWIFPPLEEPEGTREFVLFTRMDGEEARQVYSARDRRGGQEQRPAERATPNGRESAGADGDSGRNGAGGTTRDSGVAAVNGKAAVASTASNGASNGAAGPGEAAHGENGGADGNGASRADQAIVAHGRAPAGRLPGLVESLLRRLGDQRAPVHVAIEGSRRRWDELVTRLGQEAGTAGN